MRREPARRGDIRYLIGAAALVMIVAVLALAFGVVRPPAVDNLTNAQRAALPGGVAWTQFDERAGCTSLMIARPIGGVESIACEVQLDRVVAWSSAGVVTASYAANGLAIETRDPETGEVLTSRMDSTVDGDPGRDRMDSRFEVARVDGTLVVGHRSGTTVWETTADARYEIGTLAVSPNGAWVAMTDSAERLLVVRSDGSELPAVWATGVRNWAWRPVVWEGTEQPTA
jgi:hypothetical protein